MTVPANYGTEYKLIIGLIVSQFMHSLGYSLILCPYRPTLDLMTSYKIIFDV